MKTGTCKEKLWHKALSKRLLFRSLEIALVFALLVVTVQPFAFTARAGTNLQLDNYHWPNTPCNVFLYCSTSDFTRSEREAIRAAAQEWNAVRDPDGRSMVSIYLTTNDDAFETQGKIEFADVGPLYVGYTDHKESDYGELRSVIIYLNEQCDFSVGGSSTEFDIQTIVQHELGHVLGVAHCHERDVKPEDCFSATCADNVMRWDVLPGEVRTEFQPYDTSSYIRIYW